MVKKLVNLTLAIGLVSSAAAWATASGENRFEFVRSAQDPLILLLNDLPVTIHRTERHEIWGGVCGVNYVGYFGNMSTRPRRCIVEESVPEGHERISLRLHFPATAILDRDEREKVKIEFSNDEAAPGGGSGYVTISLRSKSYHYDLRALKRVPVAYDRVNDIEIALR